MTLSLKKCWRIYYLLVASFANVNIAATLCRCMSASLFAKMLKITSTMTKLFRNGPSVVQFQDRLPCRVARTADFYASLSCLKVVTV